jgi:hypothetical protein
MKTIEQIIAEVDNHNIYADMVGFMQEMSKALEPTGDQASNFENRYHLMTIKVTKLLGDLESKVAILKRSKEDVVGDKKAVSEEKSEAGKERDAKTSPEYRAVADDLAITEVALNKINNLKKFFDGGVYVMRSRQANQKKDWHSTPTNEA